MVESFSFIDISYVKNSNNGVYGFFLFRSQYPCLIKINIFTICFHFHFEFYPRRKISTGKGEKMLKNPLHEIFVQS